MSKKDFQTIIISRTDAIGDVVLTFPFVSMVKKNPGENIKIIFFGKTYTQPVINCCDSIDHFINYETFRGFSKQGQADFLKECNADAIIHVFPRKDIAVAAKKARIPLRIGTTNRFYHWLACNRLVMLSRKNSSLHEAELNMKLLKPLGSFIDISLKEIPSLYNFKNKYDLPENISKLLSPEKFRLIIHPKSNASAREWKADHYQDLIRFLSYKNFQVIITGGIAEESFISDWAKKLPANVLNLAGKLSLEDLIALINACDGIVAASTGPLHIAAALCKYSLGIFPPIRPMHPGRWAPVGLKAEYLVSKKDCSDCRNAPQLCHCINDISPDMVYNQIVQWVK